MLGNKTISRIKKLWQIPPISRIGEDFTISEGDKLNKVMTELARYYM